MPLFAAHCTDLMHLYPGSRSNLSRSLSVTANARDMGSDAPVHGYDTQGLVRENTKPATVFDFC